MSIRPAALGLVAFFALTGLAALYLGFLLAQSHAGGEQTTVRAAFRDASYLKPGNSVRIAGVRVGQVESLRMGSDAVVVVTMSVSGAPPLTDGTAATVKYENLIGDRYIELSEGTGGPPLRGTIPVERTHPALDLDALVGGFQPLFQAISPQQVNELSWSLIQVLQGEAGSLNSFLASVSAVTNTLADRDQLIGSVIDNLNGALATFDQHDQQISELITQTRQLVGGLAADRASITGAVDHLDGLTAQAAELLPRLRPDLAPEIRDLGTASKTLNDNNQQVDAALKALPDAYQRVGRIGVYGNFFNSYLCSIRFRLTGPTGEFVYTPWIDSKVARCVEGGH